MLCVQNWHRVPQILYFVRRQGDRRLPRSDQPRGFGMEEDRTTIKGISPATFLDETHDQVTVLLRTDGV